MDRRNYKSGYTLTLGDRWGCPPGVWRRRPHACANEQGARLLANVSVASAIQKAQVAVSKRIEVTVDDVVTGLLAEAEGKKDSTAGSRVAAWTQLGKHLGMDRRDINLQLEQRPVVDMTREERAAELERSPCG